MRVKRFLSYFLFSVVSLTMILSCENDLNKEESKIQSIIVAPLSTGDDTKVSLTPENNGLGFQCLWEVGDELIISSEDGDKYIVTYIIEEGNILADGSARFTPKDYDSPPLESGTKYLFYHKNDIVSPVSYNEEMSNTKKKYATANFEAVNANNLVDVLLFSPVAVSIGSKINLSHFFSYLQISVDIPGDHAGDRLRLKYTDETSSSSYTINVGFDNWTESVTSNKYIFNMAILPAAFSPNSPMTVEISSDGGENYTEVAKYVTTANLEAGKHWLIAADKVEKKWYLDDINGTTMPTSEVWTIYDATANTSSFVGLKQALMTLPAGNKVNIIFPDLTAIPANAFKDLSTKAEWTISGPKVSTILEYAFSGARNLSQISFPKATTLVDFCFATPSITNAEIAKDENLIYAGSVIFGIDAASQKTNMKNIALITSEGNRDRAMLKLPTQQTIGRFKSVNGYTGTPFTADQKIFIKGKVYLLFGLIDIDTDEPVPSSFTIEGDLLQYGDLVLPELSFMVKSAPGNDGIYKNATWESSEPNYVSIIPKSDGSIRIDAKTNNVPSGTSLVTLTVTDDTGDPENSLSVLVTINK